MTCKISTQILWCIHNYIFYLHHPRAGRNPCNHVTEPFQRILITCLVRKTAQYALILCGGLGRGIKNQFISALGELKAFREPDMIAVISCMLRSGLFHLSAVHISIQLLLALLISFFNSLPDIMLVPIEPKLLTRYISISQGHNVFRRFLDCTVCDLVKYFVPSSRTYALSALHHLSCR